MDMDITHQKLISTSSTTWEDSSLVMEDQTIHDHHSLFDPFWSSYGYENNHVQIPCSSTSPQQHQVGLTTTTTPVLDSILITNHHHHSQMEEEEKEEEEEEEELGAMKEMMFKIASMQPVDIDPATLRKPKRRNVRISDDPQSVAARHRRERISEKIRILQRLVPGGTKMDTASMLDEAIRYVKFLKRQIRQLQSNQPQSIGIGILPTTFPSSATNWGFGSIKPFSPSTGGNQVAAATTTIAAAIVGSSYNFGGGGGDNQTMCLNNEVIHN